MKSEIIAYESNYGNNQLNGWAHMYKSSTDTSPMNPERQGPTTRWAYAKVYGNAYHFYDKDPMSYEERRGVYVHEIGHTLGLDHPGAPTVSVMREEVQVRGGNWNMPYKQNLTTQ